MNENAMDYNDDEGIIEATNAMHDALDEQERLLELSARGMIVFAARIDRIARKVLDELSASISLPNHEEIQQAANAFLYDFISQITMQIFADEFGPGPEVEDDSKENIGDVLYKTFSSARDSIK